MSPFLDRWRGRREAFDLVRKHWDLRLVRACAECGACVEDCPVARADPSYDPNALIRALAAGEVESVVRSPELWKCVECYTCAELCPNKYDQMTILRQAKALAIAVGAVPAAAAEGMRAFRETGVLTQGSAAQRKRLGLPEMPRAGAEELKELLSDSESRVEPRKQERGGSKGE